MAVLSGWGITRSRAISCRTALIARRNCQRLDANTTQSSI
jgi:hypothetical protein